MSAGLIYTTTILPADIVGRIKSCCNECSLSAWIRAAICEKLGVTPVYVGHRGRPRLSDAERKARRDAKSRKYREAHRDEINERNRLRKRETRAKEIGMAIREYSALCDAGKRPREKPKEEQAKKEQPKQFPTTPEAAHFRPVSLNSARHCIDCAHCTTTGKCSLFGLRLNGPHVCDCFQDCG